MNSYARDLSRDNLIEEYEVLVIKIAKVLMRRFSVKSSLYEEMCAAGYLGLVEAAEKSDTRDGKIFRSYAAIRIRGAMIDCLRNSTVLSRRSHKFVRAMYAIQNMREQDILENDILTSPKKTAKESLARVIDLAAKGAIAFQLSDTEVQKELEQVPSKDLPADEKIFIKEARDNLEALIDALPAKEQLIIRQYYFEDKSFVAIANENQGMNKSWVSKLHSRALERLRDMIGYTDE